MTTALIHRADTIQPGWFIRKPGHPVLREWRHVEAVEHLPAIYNAAISLAAATRLVFDGGKWEGSPHEPFEVRPAEDGF